ncbi:MAG: DUF4124 domain-containing protein [Methylococcaceae bacterium]
MQTRIFSIFLVCVFCLSSDPAFAKKMYKWLNEHGETIFSDQVPPEDSQFRRESLNQKGRVIEVTEQAKTKDQQAMDNRLRALKKAQEKIIAQQAANDKVLLSTFRSLDDMEANFYATMQSLDTQRNVAQGNVKRVQNQLENQQKKAAELERNGKKIPKSLLDDIKQSETQLQIANTEIDRQLEKKSRSKADFEADIERFKFLTHQDNTSSNPSDKSKQNNTENVIGLYTCETDTLCAKAWISAHDFVKAHATTPIDTDTDKLILGRGPVTDSDMSLSVTKIEEPNKKPQLFLDISCRDSSLGGELCSSQKVRDIRSEFRPFIEAAVGQ